MGAGTQSRYRLIRPLGAGGMGEVWLAQDDAAAAGDGRVALKRLHAGLARDPLLVKQFEREAQIGQLLRHENIVAVREYLEDEQGPLLALEFVDGVTASALLQALQLRQEQVPLPVALAVAADVARALAHAHGLRISDAERPGIIHRDLSPDNVLIGRDGVTKLADFGIAKSMDATSLTRSGTVKGKFGFMAPELLEGQPADFRADVFSLAATLFTFCCGVRPFHGRTEAEQVRALLNSEPPRLTHLRPDLPAPVAEWIQSGLRRLPAERPEDTRGLLRALEEATPAASENRRAVAACVETVMGERQAFAATESADLPTRPLIPSSAPPSPETPRRRRRAWLWAVGALGLVGIAAAYQGVHSFRPATAPTAVAAVRPASNSPAPPPTPAPPVELAPTPTPTPTAATTPPTKPRGHAASSASTTLQVKVAPYAQVFLDGKLLGSTPLAPQAVTPGRHSLILVNQELHVRKKLEVTLRARESRVLRLDLTKP